MAEVLIDLGEYGKILVDAPEAEAIAILQNETGRERVSLIDDARQTAKTVKQILTTKIELEQILKLPLTGLSKAILASLPEPSANDPYELDTFSVEFNLGIKTEAGTNAGAVAKIMPEGAFKCTYTWKQKSNSNSSP